MRNLILASAVLVLLSTSVQVNGSNTQGIGRLDMKGPTINTDGLTLDRDPEDSLYEAIKDTVEAGGISPSNPLYIIIGKGVVDNAAAFNNFIEYLGKTLVKDIILTVDPSVKNNIVNIGDSFLANTRLTFFSAEGLKNVKEIGGAFLAFNDLTSFSAQGLENAKTIGRNFLFRNLLISFSAKEFKSLQSIGDNFLSGNRLASFPTQGLENVKTIGYGFLSDNNLNSFSAQGLKNVTTIGNNFLYNNRNLKTVDLSAFTEVTSVGHSFLDECLIEEVIVANEEQQHFFRRHVIPHNPKARFIIKK